MSAADDDLDRMDLELILYFTAVAEEASFTRAAQKLKIDQSWLSRKIRQLESQVGCPLMLRTTRRIELTPAGEVLLDAGRSLAEAAQSARDKVRRLAGQPNLLLRVGALPYSFTDPARIKLIHEFTRLHPEIEIEVSNNASWVLADRVRTGRLDVAFTSSPFVTEKLEILVTLPNFYAVMAPAEHPFAEMDGIRIGDWPGRKLVTPPPNRNPFTYQAIYRPFIEAGAIAVVTPEFERFAMRRAAQRNRLPILMNIGAEEEVMEGFVSRPLVGYKPRSYKCIVRHAESRNRATDLFWDFARSYFTDAVRELPEEISLNPEPDHGAAA